MARSFTDRLTGLRNYDFFAEAMRSPSWPACAATAAASTLVLLDLDRFKAYNDRHGHGAGNRLLASVGQALPHEKRDADIAARFGGEEFAVLVPGRAADGVSLAERLRRAIADLAPAARLAPRLRARHRAAPRRRRHVPASTPATPHELFEIADRALYEAKRRGRDQVVAAAEIVDPPLRLARAS